MSLCEGMTFSALLVSLPIQVSVCAYGCVFPVLPARTQTYRRRAMSPHCTWLTSHHSHFPLDLKCLSRKEKITPKQIRHNINSLTLERRLQNFFFLLHASRSRWYAEGLKSLTITQTYWNESEMQALCPREPQKLYLPQSELLCFF